MDAITSDNWPRIEPVLDAALLLPAAERAAYVTTACAGDLALADTVRSLLALAERPSVLDGSAAAFAGPVLDVAGRAQTDGPQQIGRYRVVRELGRGGMGKVYLASHEAGEVAVKVVGLKSSQLHRRFLAERLILARFDHPHIARLIDDGVTDDGQPWFAMEYVDGAPITDHCDARRLTVRDRLRLFRSVCDAVQCAHEHLVVHRDIKPSNILVTGDGVVKLLDFGIAKALSDEPGMPDKLSLAGQRMMTPEYAAPEQACGQPVTPATDVYALGAVLYELLCGRRAHRFERRIPSEILHVVCDVASAPPSAAIEQSPPMKWTGEWPNAERIAWLRRATLGDLRRELEGELDSIVLEALAKEPARRYPSVETFRADLDRQQ